MLVDLVIELAAKLPYVLAGAILLLFAKPGSDLMRPVAYGLALSSVAIAVSILCRRRILSALERAALALARRWPGLNPATSADLQLTLDREFAWNGRIAHGFTLHALSWALGAAETWVMLHMMGIFVTGYEAFVIDSLFSGLRTFTFAVPAAIGVQEAVYVLVCALFGINPAIAVALSLVRRARELVLGIPGLGLWHLVESRLALARLHRDGEPR
jgi:uncharacterized membrane protein YbhN (UPF0104 family)